MKRYGLCPTILSVAVAELALIVLTARPGTCGALDAQVHRARAEDVSILDLPVVTENGRTLSFSKDVIGDRLVAVNFIFTTCPSVCPIQSAIFAGIQKELGDRLGRDVHLVSISIDPKTDVPARLEAYAARYHARPGWTWVTGSKDNIDHILVALGAYSRVVEEHAAMILVGDGKTGGWTRFYGFPKPTAVLERIDELAALRDDNAVARHSTDSVNVETVLP